MAESPAHKFGQLLGELLESLIQPQLEDFCHARNLYLDYHKKNRKARLGKKVSWVDSYGNTHDLDFVIERGGTDTLIGRPVAFIESAWRRYTKHSRNKAQEIQGAILPLAEKYRWNNPFLGTIIAGVFTEGSIEQLHSLGFHVLYISYESYVQAFKSEGFDILFGEDTPDQVFSEMNSRFEAASADAIERIQVSLIKANKENIDKFFFALEQRLSRYITHVFVIPLYGRVNDFLSVEEAIQFIDHHPIYEGSGEFRKYEIRVEFSNGDKVEASLEAKDKVKDFLDFISRQ